MRGTLLGGDSRSDHPVERGERTDDPDTPVPATKVTVPVIASATVARDRLDAVMDAATRNGAVTVVSAPAGTGKTTMLAGWAARCADRGDTRVAWVSVDGEDNNSALLWLAVLHALRRCGGWRGQRLLDGLIPPPGGSYAPFLNAVIAAFDNSDKQVVLVLDGVHDIHADAAVHTMNVLLLRLPCALHVVLAARFTPPLMLSRLKLEGRLQEVGPDELAFTTDETRLFFANDGVHLPDATLGLLVERTEGWAAALRVAALTAVESESPADHLRRFTGNERVMADYLTAEILGRQPHDVQLFLLATSVCPAFNADLAATLSGRQNAGQLLSLLERAGVVAAAPATPPGWFRCHPLLRDHLLAELGRRGVVAQQHQHRLAAAWFAAHNDPLSAAEHGTAGGDHDPASRLVARCGLDLVLTGRASHLCRVLRALPAHVRRRPSVGLVAAAAALDLGEVARAERWLDSLDKGRSLRSRRLRALHAVVELHSSRLDGDSDSTVAALARTGTDPTGDSSLDMLALVNRGIAAAWIGHHRLAEADLRETLRLAVTEKRDAIILQCRIHLAAMAVVDGDLATMLSQAEAAREFAARHGWADTYRCSYLWALLGAQAYQRLDEDNAETYAATAMRLINRAVDPTIELSVLTLWTAVIYNTVEDPHEATAALRAHWRRLDGRAVSPALIAYAAPTRQRMALRVGEPVWALEVLEQVENLSVARGEQALLRAVLSAHKGKISSARHMLEPVLSRQARVLVASTLIEAWLLEAQLADRCSATNRAHEALCHALTLAAPQLIIRPFWDAGDPVRELLARGAGRFGRLEPFATEVRARMFASAPIRTDGLTEREQELLVELPSMRTAEEIAQTMFVSINTVKTHMRGIYRKLGVSQRRDAVSVARGRGLL